MNQNFTFTCKTQGSIIWSINKVQISTLDQVDYYKGYGMFLRLPSDDESSISINARINNDKLAVQCHQLRSFPDYIVASSDIITISLESGKNLVQRSQTLYQTAALKMDLGTWPYQTCSAVHILRQSITVSKFPGIALINHK